MKVDGGIGFDLAQVPGAARRAEELGYDGIWAGETSHDPFLAAALAASATHRLDVGTGIAVAFARNPMNLAVLANDLHLLSGGRFLLGLGSQVKAHITKRYSMPWSHPAPRMRELILAVRAIWRSWQRGEKLDFGGDFYTHTLMAPFFDPGPNPFGSPPVLVAAVGARMTEVAGEVADGLLVHAFTTERYLREVTMPALERGASRAGRTRADLQVSYAGLVVTGDDEDQLAEAARAVKAQIAFYASTPAYRPVLELHGWGELQSELNRLTKQGAWDALADVVDDEVLAAFAVVAPVDLVARRIRERFDGLVDRFSFYTPYPLDRERWPTLLGGFRSG